MIAALISLHAHLDRKVRALTRDAGCIADALRDSKDLVLSDDGKRVSGAAI